MSLTINNNSFVNNNFEATIFTQPSIAQVRPSVVDGQIDSPVIVAEPAAEKASSGGFWSRIKDGLGDLFSVDTLKNLGGGIKGFFSKIMDAGMWAGGKLGDGFWKVMEGGVWVAGKMREGVIAGAKAVGGFFKSVGEGFVDFFKNPIDRLKSFGSGIKEFGSKFWNGALWLGGKMGDGFMKFMEGGAWVAGKMREGVVAAGEAVVSAAKKVGNFIKGLF